MSGRVHSLGVSTITATGFEQHEEARETATRLVFLTEASDPRAPSSSHSLDGIDEVQFCRGARDVNRRGRTLTLSFPDRRMSAAHGSLKRHGARWILDVPASKNGAVIDGAVASRAMLSDGSIFELGYSFFVLRDERLLRPLPSHLIGDVGVPQLPRWPARSSPRSPR
jgi:pSer/pThr/pTyr-binding forkhead associated (FHA) protein